MELLKRFKEEFANFEKERQELANAEKLFGLSITLYPELLDMEKELKGLDQIFSIYENQKASQGFEKYYEDKIRLQYLERKPHQP